jgi:hypothetical protein
MGPKEVRFEQVSLYLKKEGKKLKEILFVIFVYSILVTTGFNTMVIPSTFKLSFHKTKLMLAAYI